MADRHIIRFKDIEIILPSPPAARLAGHFRCEVYECRELMNGKSIEIPKTRRVVGEFPNIITNTGLDHIGNGGTFGLYCHVGTGSAAESINDTTLDTFVASQANASYGPTGSVLWWTNGSAPFWGNAQKKYRFAPGFAGGAINVAELGVSPQATTGNLFCRALVKTGGVPTVAPVANDEYFDVYYTLRNYPGHCNNVTGAYDDGSGTLTIGVTTYNYVIRTAYINQNKFWSRSLFGGFNPVYEEGFYNRAEYAAPTSSLGTLYQGIQSTVDTASHSYTWTNGTGTYVNSSYTNSMDYQLGLDEGNLTGGIAGFTGFSTLGAYQWTIDGAVPKDNTKIMNWGFQQTWTRHAL